MLRAKKPYGSARILRVMDALAATLVGIFTLLVAGRAAHGQVELLYELKHDVSPPLRDIPATPPNPTPEEVDLLRSRPLDLFSFPVPDPVVQTAAGPLIATVPGLNFDGPARQSPGDPNGSVGPYQYFELVNMGDINVYSKATGTRILRASISRQLFGGFGAPCETTNSGDAVVVYDRLADTNATGRWVVLQPVFISPYAMCIAVSQTIDATGPWNRYMFSTSSLGNPDFPKLGVWPDPLAQNSAYYVGINVARMTACAFDRPSMLAGSTARPAQCFSGVSPTGGGMIYPADLDGPIPPPAGSPGYFLNEDLSGANNALNL